MDVIETKIDTISDEYLKNYEAMESLVVNLKEELRIAREVEDILSQHAAVQLCAIIGMLDPKRPDSQVVKAVIQLTAQALEKDPESIKKELLDHCRENLTPYKVPKVMEITDAMPLTAVGKVDKKALRAKV